MGDGQRPVNALGSGAEAHRRDLRGGIPAAGDRGTEPSLGHQGGQRAEYGDPERASEMAGNRQRGGRGRGAFLGNPGDRRRAGPKASMPYPRSSARRRPYMSPMAADMGSTDTMARAKPATIHWRSANWAESSSPMEGMARLIIVTSNPWITMAGVQATTTFQRSLMAESWIQIGSAGRGTRPPGEHDTGRRRPGAGGPESSRVRFS